MARDVSIAISARDNFSQAITTMRNANQAFNKDLTGLSSKLDALNKTKITLKVEVDKAKSALKEAEKQFSATGEAADRLKLEMANANYENVRQNFSLVSQNAKQAEKDILSLTNAISKSENRAGTSGGSGGASGKNLLGTLGSAGLTQMVGSALSGAANTLIGSQFGSEVGTMFSSVLSSVAAGAALGSLVPIPVVGTAIGAAIGGVTGLISGATKIYENKDEAFKSYYQGQYESIQEEQNTSLTQGVDIAATREQNRISFATLLGGEQQADEFLSQLTQFASVTPFEYDDLTNISKTMLAYGYGQQDILPLLSKVGDTGSALGMSTQDMNYVATALGRMQSTGKTTLEYLNPLLERGIPVWDYLAKASGKTRAEVQEMVSKGLVPGAEAAKAIADYMGSDFAGNMEKQALTFSGLTSTLQDAQAELYNAMGEAYNTERKKGLQEQIDFLSGDMGTEMQKAYSQIELWKASLQNLAEQYERDAFTAVMSGSISDEFSPELQARLTQMNEEYIKYASDGSEEAGAKIGALFAEAQALSQNEYNASEGAQLLLESNENLAQNILNNAAVNDAFWDAGFQMGKQFEKGMAAAISSISPEETIVKHGGILGKLESFFGEPFGEALKKEEPKTDQSAQAPYQEVEESTTTHGGLVGFLEGLTNPFKSSHAYGLGYVPYDNYPAYLHEGERVLTASENRNYQSGGSFIMKENNFIVREEADIDKIVQKIAMHFKQAAELAI